MVSNGNNTNSSTENNTMENKDKDVTKRKEDQSQGLLSIIINGVLDILNSLF